MAQLNGKRIVIAGSQKIDELSHIIEKHGGVPLVRSMQGLTFTDEARVDQEVRLLVSSKPDWIVFTTGIGFAAIRSSAERLGLLPEWTECLKQAQVASRGYRTFAFLKNLGIEPDIIADDGSIHSVVEKLQRLNLEGSRVWIQLHGQPHSELLDAVKAGGAAETLVSLPYLYQPPEPEMLETLVSELKAGAVDAVCFTTRAQIGYLFDYARETGSDEVIRQAFAGPVLAVAVGKVTAEGLRDERIERIIVPQLERMSGMVQEIARHYAALSL